ncbi:MAG TPA: pyruvate, phosphate dikinase [Dehalococcoidia bacterium]|nr:pyruvate, phosphate dikinase [Dehalococcoidia bacterium]
MSKAKRIYRFREGSAEMRDLLGGKGANLCEMAKLDLPVPPGFTITTEVCRQYYQNGGQLPESFWKEVRAYLAEVEQAAGRKFGDVKNPLLVSVRSGARFSMPGMMDTVLNLGLNSDTVQGLAGQSGDERFALDSYRRFIQLFGKVVLGVPDHAFEEVLSAAKQRAGVDSDAELDPQELRLLVQRFKELVQQVAPAGFPEDPWQQLELAIEAVFKSWNNRRAIAYREYNHIPHDLYTACTVMAMVFGNLGWESATGVAFTRSPETGEKEIFGEYLANAQGEDVVSGVRTPKPIKGMAAEFPEVHSQLSEIAARLERHYRDMQDIEFTIERNRLYILQTRSAKRAAFAAVKVAVDMVAEGLISQEEALMRVAAADLPQLYLPRFDEAAKKALGRDGLLGRGLNASPGAATGKVAFTADTAIAMAQQGIPVILVRPETAADDMPGILQASGVLTSRGGRTSHAAVVTRGLGKPAVVGCEDIKVDPDAGSFTANGHTISEGQEISIDGFTGEVFLGCIEMVTPETSNNRELATLLHWADERRQLRVRANADTPADARTAITKGAEGIGLCRTEHMFFQEERLPYVRQMMIKAQASFELRQLVDEARRLAANEGNAEASVRLREAEEALSASPDWQAYQEALARLLSYQRQDFLGILQVMEGKPVVIRLLDAPLHEFLESYTDLIQRVAVLRATDPDSAELKEKEEALAVIKRLQEMNPMLGHRGCRFGVTYPEVYEMQVRAICEAACELKRQGVDLHPEIMIPLVSHVSELQALKGRLQSIVNSVLEGAGVELEIRFGTMIEVPRAALTAGEIAPNVDFFSFGSNDLTQMTFGFSRDDAEEKFLSYYVQTGLLPISPFNTLDKSGVGRLIRIAAEEGKRVNPGLELGICGEHGGDPESVLFCHQVGLDYVSCSPHRIPIARLAAAQAVLGAGERDV